MTRSSCLRLLLVAVLVGCGVAVASAQTPGRPLPGGLARVPGGPGGSTGGSTVDVLGGGPPQAGPLRAPLTITPRVSVFEEFDDNVLLNNANRQWDFITNIIPGIEVLAAGALYSLDVSYDFTAREFAREPDRNRAFDRQFFTLDALYRVTPEVTLRLGDNFTFDTGINALASQGVATGNSRFWSNSIDPGVDWQIDRLTSIRGTASWTTFHTNGAGLRDSDTYRAGATLTRALSPRLSVIGGYEFVYFDIENRPKITTHTPRAGVRYEFSPTLTGAISAGPTFELTEGGDSRVTPAVTASIDKRFKFGTVGLTYDRSVGTAGALGGTSDNQTIRGSVAITNLYRGVTVEFVPQYQSFERGDAIDVEAFSVPLQVTWQITPWFGVAGGYVLFHQRSNTTIPDVQGTSLGRDIDQSRVFLGVTFGYPIKID